MNISNNILQECLKNVYFINGTAYAGKSTMVRLLAAKHNMIHCGENYHSKLSDGVAVPDQQPNLSYFKTMSGWQEFIHRTPDEYGRWIDGCATEASEFEIAELLRLSYTGKKIIVDTNISVENLREISDYKRVAIMLNPQSMSVDKFFERDDEDKQFLLKQIQMAEDPQATMKNFKACLAKINGPEVYARFQNSGFYTLYREDSSADTKSEALRELEAHFELCGD